MDFSPGKKQDTRGWVMVQVLSCKSSALSVDQWLAGVAANANQNPHVSEKRIIIAGNPALAVRYRTAKGSLMDAVYVVSGENTFSISFSGDEFVTPLEELPNYSTYRAMVESFQVHTAPNCAVTTKRGLGK